MRRSEWVRVGVAGSLVALVAFGLGAGSGGHSVPVPVAATRPDGECWDALRSLVDQGVRVFGLGEVLPRACEGFDRGAVLTELQEVVVQGCGLAVADGRPGGGECVGVSGVVLGELGRVMGRPAAGAG